MGWLLVKDPLGNKPILYIIILLLPPLHLLRFIQEYEPSTGLIGYSNPCLMATESLLSSISYRGPHPSPRLLDSSPVSKQFLTLPFGNVGGIFVQF